MTVASVKEMAADFAGYLKASKQGPVVVTRRGKPVAILLGAPEDELERVLMGHSPKLQAILEAARKRFRAGEGIPHEQFWQEIETENAAKAKKRSIPRKDGRIKRQHEND